MQADLPHTIFKDRVDAKGEKPQGRSAKVNPNDPAFALQQEAYERKLARIRAQQEGREPLTMDDIFGK